MFSVTSNNVMLSPEERPLFTGFLREHGVDETVWDVYARFVRVSTRATQARVLRVYDDGTLVGAAFVARCKGYGKSLFNVPILSVPIDLIGLPSFIWIRVGFCAEVLANPGFVADGSSREGVVKAMIGHLRHHSYGVMIVDSPANRPLHGDATEFRYVSDGLVRLNGLKSVQDYVDQHHNVKRKIKHFVNKGGSIETIHGRLDEPTRQVVANCIASTAERSVIHSPFQDGFPQAVSESCSCALPNLVHLIARMNGEMLGYHSFLRTGRGLRMLHGAFDRTKPTTHHCYENLIIAAVEYAIEAGLEAIHFGPILNETKRRMMNTAEPSALFFHSNNPLMRVLIPSVFPYTKMQCAEFLRYAQ